MHIGAIACLVASTVLLTLLPIVQDSGGICSCSNAAVQRLLIDRVHATEAEWAQQGGVWLGHKSRRPPRNKKSNTRSIEDAVGLFVCVEGDIQTEFSFNAKFQVAKVLALPERVKDEYPLRVEWYQFDR